MTSGHFIAGGGLSAAQAALFAVNRGAAAVTLCSRRPLETRHFDLPLKWFDPRHIIKERFPFYAVSANVNSVLKQWHSLLPPACFHVCRCRKKSGSSL